DAIDQTAVANALGTAGFPDPDLLIRTSGEMRISNFFLWQIAYTELYVTDTLWPDFRDAEFIRALVHYQQRERRFGRTSAQHEGDRAGAARGAGDSRRRNPRSPRSHLSRPAMGLGPAGGGGGDAGLGRVPVARLPRPRRRAGARAGAGGGGDRGRA